MEDIDLLPTIGDKTRIVEVDTGFPVKHRIEVVIPDVAERAAFFESRDCYRARPLATDQATLRLTRTIPCGYPKKAAK